MTPDRAHKHFAKILQFLFADARNAAELRYIRRIFSRHFAQRYIGEDDISGHASFICELAAQRTQALKQYFVAFDRAWP